MDRRTDRDGWQRWIDASGCQIPEPMRDCFYEPHSDAPVGPDTRKVHEREREGPAVKRCSDSHAPR